MPAPISDAAGIRQTVRALRTGGYRVTEVWDGEEAVPVRTENDVVEAVTAVDEATLYVEHDTERESFVFFVLGNSPEEVICDHGVSLSPVLDPLMEKWD